jgi:Family of unknown function (DUF6441)
MMSARLDMGDFEKRRKAIAKAPMVASKRAIVRGVALLETELDEDAARVFGGVQNWAWLSEVFPKGARLANNPAGVVYSKAPHIIDGFSSGETIKGKLYIPIKGTPADIRKPRNGSRVAAMVRKFGRPFELPQKDGSGWLLLFKTRTSSKSGGVISAQVTNRKTGLRVMASRGVTWTPFFVVEPAINLGKRLRTEAIFERFTQNWPSTFNTLIAEELKKS